MRSLQQASKAIEVVNEMVIKDEKNSSEITESIYPSTTDRPSELTSEDPSKTSTTKRPPGPPPEEEEVKVEAKEAKSLTKQMDGFLKVITKFTDKSSIPPQIFSREHLVRMVSLVSIYSIRYERYFKHYRELVRLLVKY